MYKSTNALKTCVVQGSAVHTGPHFNHKSKTKFGESTFTGVGGLGGCGWLCEGDVEKI